MANGGADKHANPSGNYSYHNFVAHCRDQHGAALVYLQRKLLEFVMRSTDLPIPLVVDTYLMLRSSYATGCITEAAFRSGLEVIGFQDIEIDYEVRHALSTTAPSN